MFELGTKEIVIIVALIILLFGSKKIPELSKNLVQAVKNLKGIFEDDSKKTGTSEGEKK